MTTPNDKPATQTIGQRIAEEWHPEHVESALRNLLAARIDDAVKPLVEALQISQALTRKYISRVTFEGLGDREITELREVHYQASIALQPYTHGGGK